MIHGLACLLGLLPLHASAQYAAMEGDYASPLISLKVIVLDRKGTAAASLTVVSGACSGSIAGVGTFTARTLQFSSHTKEEGGEACRVSAQFDKLGRQVTITDNGQCSVFMGASCEWNGQTARKVPERKR
ncbi:hypothetical protein ACQ859_20735 [Roseateles chitinivorans]|uniref:hypothetical protein n=1 Tax=Roseateles chitinivorans TaxID=2917965 RepID=UPI003D67FE10